MIYPENFESKIGFDKIREQLKANCLCSLGKERVGDMQFLNLHKRINHLINEVDEFKQICLLEDFPVSYFIDVTPSLKKLRIEGTYLETNELFDLRKSLSAIAAILRFFKNKTDEEYPYLLKLTSDINVPKFIVDKVDMILNKYGKIKDNASGELQAIRRELLQRQSSVSKRLTAMLKQAQAAGWADPNLSLTMVNGRTVIPIHSTYKRKIQGLVHDESATGKTSYLEPAEIVNTNNEIKELEYAERREIIKILVNLSLEIRPYLDDLFMAYDFLGVIDFIRAKALFAITLDAIKPAFQDEQIVHLLGAKHPLLYLAHRKEGKPVVPLNIELTRDHRIVLISGPNAGGKSVCLKTVGLLQYMLQCGLLIPVSGATEMGLFENLFIDIGDEQSIENDLSTYSSHLTNMKHFVKNANDKTLILIDEFGTGTEPMLGGAIAEAVLGDLNENKVFGVITTHYTNLKHFATSVEGIANGAMQFDTNKMEPLFKLELGKPGSSFAFEIARKIGLPEKLLANATEKIGQEHIDFDKHLRQALRDKYYWENKRKKIRQNEKRLEETLERYKTELDGVKKQRKEILDNAKREAEELLTGTNKQIENTIRQIKEANAEKEKTKEVRRELEDFKKQLEEQKQQDDDKIQCKIDQIKRREERKKEQKEKEPTSKVEKKPEKKIVEIEVGDTVRIIGQETVGEVVEKKGNNFTVTFGSMSMSVKKNMLEYIGGKKAKKQTKKVGVTSVSTLSSDYSKKLQDFKLTLDVRGQRVEEALQNVIAYIDEAIVLDVNEVRLLHGKGNGILRQVIREYLATVNVISSFKDEILQLGGTGITVVRF